MCGIAGIVSLDGSPIPFWEKAIDAFSHLLEHRGPDAKGWWLSEKKNCLLVHKRLSIIDLSEDGVQPMVGQAGDQLIHNGEIYNHMEIREQFRSRNWRSKSDSEAILATFEKYGTDCVEKLDGMFAYAIWSEREQTLDAARDRIGIKPFYYAVIKNRLIFASEIKAILPFLEKIETNQQALGEYVSFQYTLSSNTMFEGVEQLMPGECLTVKNGEIRKKQYWNISYEVDEEKTESEFMQSWIGE